MAAPPAAPEPVGEPPVLASIAELIASGEAWASDLDFHPRRTPLAIAEPPAPEVTPLPPPVVAPVVTAAPQQPGARASLEAALAGLLPHQAAEAMAGPPAQAPTQHRVQLGFRDGTSATLEPGSDQSRALEELAQSLTRRD